MWPRETSFFLKGKKLRSHDTEGESPPENPRKILARVRTGATSTGLAFLRAGAAAASTLITGAAAICMVELGNDGSTQVHSEPGGAAVTLPHNPRDSDVTPHPAQEGATTG